MLQCSALDLGCANVCWGVSLCGELIQLKIILNSVSPEGVTGVSPPYLDPKFWCVFVFICLFIFELVSCYVILTGLELTNRPDWPHSYEFICLHLKSSLK